MGKHFILNLYECPFELLDDKEFIRMLLYRATKECKATLLNLAVHKFDPQGVTGIAMLAESHISIHTWPETGQAAVDIYTCGDCDPQLGCDFIISELKSGRNTLQVIER
jgi:S-adenosylmethionine decarboxylase